MIRISDLRMPLDHSTSELKEAILAYLEIPAEVLLSWHIARRGYDARRRGQITFIYHIDCAVTDETLLLQRFNGKKRVSPAPNQRYEIPRAPLLTERPVVIGAGPCGLMAGLILAEAGLKPLIMERGCPVRERTVDTFAFWRKGIFNAMSNVQFGEGGAGTFSDGKLYSGVSDPRHLGRKVLETFVDAGAPEEILYLSKPHIGTFRLVSMVERLRERIQKLGGEYHFNSRVEALAYQGEPRHLVGLYIEGGHYIATRNAVLAVGHSARDVFSMLANDKVAMQAKPFSVGVRIEHPQGLIDKARLGSFAGHPKLGAADYKLVHKASSGRAVYSFCMCPGGTVVAATSSNGQVVTNGMSQYSRKERNANSALVVEVVPGRDYPDTPLAGLAFQEHWERAAFTLGGANYYAPVQRVDDFLRGRPSQRLGAVVPSYQPGVTPTDLSQCLPNFVVEGLREALPAFEEKLPSFAMGDAVLTAIETRTSSPVRITRDVDGQSPSVRGLFPAGEGAGYAGGILSAGIDGIRAAEWVIKASQFDSSAHTE